MATATVAEFKDMGDAKDGKPQIAQFPPLVTQTAVTYTSSAQSAAFGSDTMYVLLTTNTAGANYKVGTNPTATANDPWLGPNSFIFIGVTAGDKVAFYDGST